MKDSNPGKAGTIINDGIRVGEGDVTFGTHIERLIINLYRDSSPLQLDDQELRELRDAYLDYLRQQCQTLDFKGIRLPEAVRKNRRSVTARCVRAGSRPAGITGRRNLAAYRRPLLER